MLAQSFEWQASEPNHETAQHLPATISCKLCVRTLGSCAGSALLLSDRFKSPGIPIGLDWYSLCGFVSA